MFQPAEDDERRSIFKRDGGHYNIFHAGQKQAMDMLRRWFPDAKANEMNFVLFSTSGVHGCYTTLEAIEASLAKYPDGPPSHGEDEDPPDDYCVPEVTFVLVQPRLVSMTYGNALFALDDLPFLKALRASSWDAVREIGAEEMT